MNEDLILYEVVNMSNWCKRKPLLILLKNKGFLLSDRKLRTLVAYNNILFNEHKRDLYIAHSNQYGYIATNNKAIIKASIADLEARAMDMLWKVSSTKKRLCEEGYEQLL